MAVCGDAWVAEEECTVVLKENIIGITGDSFTIKDAASGDTLIQANAAIFSIKDCIELQDGDGNEVCTIKSCMLTLLPTFQILKGGEVIATVRKDRFSMHKTIRVYAGDASFNPLTNSTDNECLLVMKGGLIFERNTTIYKGDSDETAAYSHECRISVADIIGSTADCYEITVQPGVDKALVCAAMICKDEILEDKKEDDAAAAEAANTEE
eukprot:TRINITY_DN37925_c0_g1_i1.p1 TRINITY_DN37925_c0_g1~~TRINITY_DN37925_c0_g1_i1.p1  ORF type:complete len:232 (+),score=69.62 TRINITY_DN37925_c0_g1_i1:65-697(+)